MKYTALLSFVLFAFAGACAPPSAPEAPPARPAALLDDEFGDYWYQGDAELTSYALEQARYGEIHQGEAVLIFVTEDFSRSKQVKMDFPDRSSDDRATVLKLNFTKKFTTGIYPYSMMTSVFTPIERGMYPHTLKVTTSSQEWCGHTFTQFNWRKGAYDVKLYSYFEEESDQTLKLDDVLLEDELWTLIRLDPSALPSGEIDIVPGTMYQRLSHDDWAIRKARASTADAGDGQRIFTLVFPELDRTLAIRFNAAFPYEIEGWEDTHRSGFGPNAPLLTTRATRNKRMMLDYWTRHNNADLPLREELGL
ncbi:MAG: hypothetical protein R2834_17900 [Rhodothermales bacterium]